MRNAALLVSAALSICTAHAWSDVQASAPSFPPDAHPPPTGPTVAPNSPAPPAASSAPPTSAAPGAAPTEFPMLEGRTTASSAPCPQSPGAYRHDGFYLRFGSGLAYVAHSGDGPLGNASVSGLGSLAFIGIGGNVERGLVVGGVLSVASTDRSLHGAPSGVPGRVTASLVNLGVLLDWFPNPAAGWHIGGSFGFGGPSLADENITWTGIGATGSVFGGYDWWIGPEWSLGVSLAAMGSPKTSLKDSDQKESGYRFASGSIGILGSILLH